MIRAHAGRAECCLNWNIYTKQGRSDGGYIGIYTPPKISRPKIIYVVILLL